jgi:hypothetical protein
MTLLVEWDQKHLLLQFQIEEIINTIRKCPSCALNCSINGAEYRNQILKLLRIVVISEVIAFSICAIVVVAACINAIN